MPYGPIPASTQVSPTNPAGTTSATNVMAGLGVAGAGGGWSITPQITGRVLALCTGIMNDATTAMTVTVQIGTGTGSAPAAGAAVGGTTLVGSVCQWITLTGQLQLPFSLFAIVSGLAVPSINSQGQTASATPVWFDLAFKVSAANSFTLTNLACTLIEI